MITDEFPWSQKLRYERIFDVPAGNWTVEAIWDEGYLQAALTIIDGVLEHRYNPRVEGVAGIFLARHAIELALKYVIFKARWLRDAHTNASRDEIEDVKTTHGLGSLWETAKRECVGKIEPQDWASWDIASVDRCVAEFERVDPRSDRFRYFGRTFGVQDQPSGYLGINFQALRTNLVHVTAVLGMVDTYLHETHGMNEEWEQILESY